MSKKKIAGICTGAAAGAMAVTAHIMKKKAEKSTYKAKNIEAIPIRKRGLYEKYIKRALDVVCATAAIVCFSPLYAGVAILVKVKLGSPVLFTQDRPGLVDADGKETIFKMYKFRTMTDERDKNGELLPDEVRLTKFGKWLRQTSLDELPEAFNILNGDSGIIGTNKKNLDFTRVSLAYSNFVMIIFLCVVSIERGNKYKKMVSWMLILTHTIS